MEQTKQTSPDEIIQEMMKKFRVPLKEQQLIQNPSVTELKGYRFPPGFGIESAKYVSEEWDIPENSVFISSFPKTGTAWTNEIVRQILYGRNEKLLQLSKSVPIPLFLLEMGPAAKYKIINQLPLPSKVFPTHLPEELFPFDKMKKKNGKMIFLMRNPKDQAVSWFHFVNKMLVDEEIRKKYFGIEWNEFYNRYVHGEHPHSTKNGEWYPDHILGWMKHKNDENFLIVVYENMKENFPREIRRIAKFLDVELSDDDVDHVKNVCSIDSMKKEADKDESGFHKMNVRKGEVGGWKEQLTVAQSELMDKLIKEKLGNSGIDFTYVL